MIVSVSVPINSIGRLRNEACKFGVQADLIDTSRERIVLIPFRPVIRTTVYVDLHSAPGEKIDAVIERSGATILDTVDKIEHGEPVRPYPNRQTKDETTAIKQNKPFVW